MEAAGLRIHRLKPFKNDSHEVIVAWKQHNVRATNAVKPMNRTLHISLLPSHLRIEHNLKLFMTQFGVVENIIFSQDEAKSTLHRDSYLLKEEAFVVFKKPKSLAAILSLDLQQPLFITKIRNELKSPVDEIYENSRDFDSILSENVKEREEKESQWLEVEKNKSAACEEDEGWQTVTKTYKPTETEFSKKKREKKALQKKRKLELVNFYAFQEREKKAKHYAANQKLFETTAQELAKRKQARVFKPL